MATIEVAHLSDHLEDNDLESIFRAVEEISGKRYESSDHDDTEILESRIDGDVFSDFRDRLEANDLDADIYLPVEFDEIIEVGDYRVASTLALRLVLDSLREDFFVEDAQDDDFEEDEGDAEFEREDLTDDDEAAGYYADEDDGIEMKDEQLRHIWRAVYRGTTESINRNLPLFLHD